jgi:hypothetical protein
MTLQQAGQKTTGLSKKHGDATPAILILVIGCLVLAILILCSLPVAVADDVAALVVPFDVPGRRETAACGHHRDLGRPAQPLQGRGVQAPKSRQGLS